MAVLDAATSEGASDAPRLGLRGLPDNVVELARGQVYAIAADAQPLRLPLVAQTLRDTLERGLRACVVLPGDPAAFLSKARLGGADLDWWHEQGELVAVRLKADPLAVPFRNGPAAVLEHVDRTVPDGHALLVIEQAEPLLFFGDAAQAPGAADALREWAARRGVTVLATFAPGSRPQREAVALRAVAEDFAGHATMREHGDGAHLELRHWFGAHGAVPRGALPLRLASDGTLVSAPAPAVPDRPRADGVQQVVAVEKALDDAASAVRDARWNVVPTAAAALEAARGLAAGAVVLAFGRETPLRTVANAVVALRRAASPWVAVVVRERGFRMRLAQQVALIRLGASCVVPEGQDDAALAQALRALGGTAFMRAVPDDLEATLAAAGTNTSPQLLVTRAFRDLVSDVLVASEAIELPHALLHVACDPAKAQQLGTLALQRRLRDAALTVDPTGLWMFLFGCPASRAPTVAQRTFGRAFPEVSSAITVHGTPGTIAARIERLAGAVGMPELDAARLPARVAATRQG
ncbi:MAG TPA: BcsE family c-di-GMP-binding protein [Burkholderiaceae bacterium]|nr:BcsE family c-di-GMP-binding protein [Burkholderiaceae bacterium]